MNKSILFILVLSFGVALTASIFASSHPDGLEKVAEDLGFINAAAETPGAMPDYIFPGIKNEVLATVFAGIIGTLLTFWLFWTVAKFFRPASQ